MLLIINVSLSCTKKPCAQNEGYKQSKAQLDYLMEHYSEDLALSGRNLYAIFFLEKLSGIKSHVSYGDISIYNKDDDFELDIDNWSDWIEQNKCHLSTSKVNKIKAELDSNSQWLMIKNN